MFLLRGEIMETKDTNTDAYTILESDILYGQGNNKDSFLVTP